MPSTFQAGTDERNENVELRGRELEAIDIALRQFRQDRFSKSGDLKHFSIELTREPRKLFVTFGPDTDERTHRIDTGAQQIRHLDHVCDFITHPE